MINKEIYKREEKALLDSILLEKYLKNKRIKGAIKFKGEVSYPEETLKEFTRNDFKKIYEELAVGFAVQKDEVVVISPLVVKGKN